MMSGKRIIAKITISFFLSVSFLTLFSNTYAEECNPPLWALKPLQLEGFYFGVGSAPFGKDDEETKSTAYQRAVGALALMAGQTITASFEEYVKEEKIKGKWAEESKAINTIKNIARQELRGITIKDFYKDTCEKLYYVLVVIDKKDANAQIRENAERLKETELKDLIDKGISKLEGRIASIEQRLARLEESAKNEKQIEGLAGVGEQVKFIKAAIAAGKSREEIEQILTAAEWYDKAYDLQIEIQNPGKGDISDLEKPILEKVIDYYSKSIFSYQNYSDAYNNRGIAYAGIGDYARAISDLNQAILLNPKFTEAYYNRGRTYDEKGDLDRAISDFNQTILLNPKFTDAYSCRGLAYFDKGDIDRAISNLNQAILLNPEDAMAYSNRGLAYFNKGDLDRAFSDYNQAILLNPKNSTAYGNRGFAYFKIGDLDRAFSDFNQAILLNPKDAIAYYKRGYAYGSKGDCDRSISDLNQAILLNPKFVEAYLARGLAYHTKGDYDRAISDFNQAILLNPKFPEMAYLGRGYAYHKRGNYNKAISDYSQAISLDPQNVIALYGRACVYSIKSNKEKALSDLINAIQLNLEFKKVAQEDEDFKKFWNDKDFKKIVR